MSENTATKLTVEHRPMLVKAGRLQQDKVRACCFLLLPEKAVKLNDTAAAILQLCDGQHTISEIHSAVSSLFSVDDVLADVMAFLERVNQQGWITINES